MMKIRFDSREQKKRILLKQQNYNELREGNIRAKQSNGKKRYICYSSKSENDTLFKLYKQLKIKITLRSLGYLKY